MSLPLPSESQRVARDTAQYDALKKATDAFDESFLDISRAVHHPWKGPVKVAPDNWNSLLSDFKRTGSALVNMLNISFENPKWEKRLKKYIRRLNNLKKMLKTLLAPSDFDAFQEMFYGLATKSKDPWQKYLPYRDEVLAIIRNFDSEAEGVVRVGGFRAALMTAPGGSWDADAVSQLKAILGMASAKMKRAGLGAFADGLIYAYPQARIPPSAGVGGRGTVGVYRMGTDELFLAIGKNPKEAADVLVHELGHRIYYKFMGGRGRSSWVDFYEAGKGAPPNLSSILSLWKRFVDNPDMGGGYHKEFDRKHAAVFYPWLKEKDREAAEWLQIVLTETGAGKGEKTQGYGTISRSSKPALDELLKADVKVFLNPVTAYSASSAEELFAEAFMAAVGSGPGTLNPVLRSQFRKALPQAKMGSRDVCNPLLISHSWIDPHGKVHELKGAYAHESWAVEFVAGVPSLRKEYQEGRHTAGHLLLSEGWIRVANFTGVELGRSVSRKALKTLADVIVKCAVKRRDVDPFEPVIFVDEFRGGSDLLSVADAVKLWGGTRMEEQMFDRLSARLAKRFAAKSEVGGKVSVDNSKLARIARKREAAARLKLEWNKREAKTYTKIAMFDFDGTLFRSWEKTPDWWKGSELDSGQYSFFVRPESLDEPCVPSRPDSSYWISNVVQQAREDSSKRGTYVVLITGRVGIHERRVKELLKQAGIRPNKMYFNPGMSAATFKIRVLRSLLAGLNTVDEVEIWENENQGAYESAIREVGKKLERDIKVTVHSIDVPPQRLVCGPSDFGLGEKS